MISVKTLKGILGCLAAVVVLAGCSSAYKPMEVYTGGQEERQGSGKAGETGTEPLEAGAKEPGAMEPGLSESERDESQQSGPGNGREGSGMQSETGGLDSGKTQESWKQAYIDFLDRESHVGEPGGYTLIEMRGDEAPQLVEVGTSEASGCRIIHYSGGKACVTQLNRLGFDYIPGGNLLRNGDGLMDHYYDLIYSIVDGEMKLVASGYYGRDDNAAMEFDAEGNPVYQYEWNGVSMSREEYDRELGKVYDSSKAVTYEYGSLYSADEMRNVIEGY